MSKQAEFGDKENKVAKKSGPENEQSQKSLPHQTEGDINASTFTHLQQTVGNQAVQAMMAQRKGDGPSVVDDEIAASVKAEKGKGSQLDEGIANKAGQVMGQDFSGVNIHTDSKADALSRDIGAKAFTTGNDIFFKEGEYNPSSSEGQHLISHELTHVVQQGAGSVSGVQGKMTVNDPNDKYEAEADKVADAVMSNQNAGVQREAEIDGVQRAEEEEEMQAKADDALQREEEEEMQMEEEEEEEEEEVQAKADDALQRTDEEEVQMEEEEEEEEMQAKADETLQRTDEEEEEKGAEEGGGDLKEEVVEEKEEAPVEEEAEEEEEEKAA